MIDRASIQPRREALGLSMRELADRARVSRTTLRALEAENQDCRATTVAKVCRALDSLEAAAGSAPCPGGADLLVTVEIEIEGGPMVRIRSADPGEMVACMLERLTRP